MPLSPRPSSPLAALGAVVALLAIAGLAAGERETTSAPSVHSRPAEDPAPVVEAERLLADEPMDLNRASAADLQLLPRIGPTLAARIVEDRAANGPFSHVQELTRVRGIGPATLERLRANVTVHPE